MADEHTRLLAQTESPSLAHDAAHHASGSSSFRPLLAFALPDHAPSPRASLASLTVIDLLVVVIIGTSTLAVDTQCLLYTLGSVLLRHWDMLVLLLFRSVLAVGILFRVPWATQMPLPIALACASISYIFVRSLVGTFSGLGAEILSAWSFFATCGQLAIYMHAIVVVDSRYWIDSASILADAPLLDDQRPVSDDTTHSPSSAGLTDREFGTAPSCSTTEAEAEADADADHVGAALLVHVPTDIIVDSDMDTDDDADTSHLDPILPRPQLESSAPIPANTDTSPNHSESIAIASAVFSTPPAAHSLVYPILESESSYRQLEPSRFPDPTAVLDTVSSITESSSSTEPFSTPQDYPDGHLELVPSSSTEDATTALGQNSFESLDALGYSHPPPPGYVLDAIQLMWSGDIAAARTLLSTESAHRLLPRPALHYAETFVIEHYLTQSSECEQSARSQVGVSEAVILKFLDNGLAAEAGLPIRPSSPSPPTTPVSSPPSSSLSGSFLATRRRFSSFQKPTGHDAHEDGSLMQLTRADSQCCLADICVIKGMYQVLDGRDIKGAYYLRKAWTIYSQLWHDITSIRPHDEPSNPQRRPVEHVRFDRAAQEYLLSWDSVRSSVSCGIGLFNILLSILGESFSVSFRNIGVNANVGAGLGLMNEAVHGNSFRAPVAAVLLIQHYVSHGRSMSLATNRLSSIGGSSKVQESSLVDMRAYLERRFPSGPVVQHMLAQLDRSHGNWSQQVPVTAALAHQHPGFQLLRIEYAVSLVIEGNWAGAADILSRLWRQSHQPQPSAASTHTESIGFVDTWLLVGILLCGCLSITELLQDSPNDRGSDHEGSLERPSLAVASRLSEQSRALQGTHRSLNNTPGRSYRLQCLQHLLQITRQIENEAKIRTVSPLWLFLTLYLRRDLEYACSDPSRSPATQALYAAVSRLSTKARDAASSSGSLEFVAMHEIIWSLVRGAIAKYSILPFTIAQMALDPIVNASSPAIQSGISPAQADKPSAQIGGRSPVLTGRPPTQIQQTLQREAVEYLSKCAERQTLPTRTAAKPDPLVTMAALFAEFELGEYLCLMGQRANGVLRLRACLNSRLVSKDTPLIVLHRSGLPECVIHDLRQRCEQAIAKHSEPHTLPTTDTAARPHGHRPS